MYFMSSFEYEGKNIDKAVKKACGQLNLTQDEIDYEVLSYGSSGIFGLAGAKKARILVNLPDKPDDVEKETGSADIDSNAAADFGASIAASEYVGSDGQAGSPFPESPLERGRAVLQRIVNAITTDAEIRVEEDSERVLLKVAGGNAAMLIGKKGHTLEAIQSIVDKIVNKQNSHHPNGKIRIQVDVEGYLENRKTNLEKLAIRLADKAKRIRKPISMGQMNAYDRRIVHLALKDDPEVRTKSRGEGYLRKLVIFPQKNNRQRINQ
jgi:spoIIIJ-associated protein